MISAARKEEHDARPAWLWAKRQPITGTLTKHYLRAVYGITCALPPTLGYLPPSGAHGAAVIAAFSIRPNFARMPAELKISKNRVVWEQLHNQAGAET